MGIGNDLGQILIALVSLGQHPDVIGFVIFPARFLIVLVIGHHIALAPDDGLDSALFRLLDEVDRTEQIPMIGQGHRGLAELDRPVHQPIHTTTPVQQAEIGMHVQVHEIFVFVGHENFFAKDYSLPKRPPSFKAILLTFPIYSDPTRSGR